MTAFVTYNGRLLIKDAKFNDIPLILELMDVYPILGKIFSHKLLDFVFNRKRNMFYGQHPLFVTTALLCGPNKYFNVYHVGFCFTVRQ